MLTVKEIRTLAASLSEEQFRVQMGPFALIQRPPTGAGKESGATLAGTGKAHPEKMSAQMVSLLFEFEDLVVATLPPLNGTDELSVGRLPDCELIIKDSSVSKRHAVLRWSADKQRCSVTDVGSTNGTFLNAASAVQSETVLRDGDILSFGDVQFWYLLTDTLYAKLSQHHTTKLRSRSG